MTTVVDHLGNVDDPGPTPLLWDRFDPLETIRNPAKGFYDWDDFIDSSIVTGSNAAGWRKENDASGDSALSTNVVGYGGVLEVGGGSTIDQGSECWRNGNSFLAKEGTTIIAEARMEFTVGTSVQFFWGLANDQAVLFGTGENGSLHHVGFEIGSGFVASDPGELLFVTESGGSRTSYNSPHTITLAQFVKLGFVITGTNNIKIYVDGVKKGPDITTNVPIVSLTPHFAHLMEGTSGAVVRADWMRVAQISDTQVTRET